MKRVIVYCEGPTEETFVNRLLAPFLQPKAVFLKASSYNGVSKYSKIRRELITLCRGDTSAVITTMLDYYGLPSDTPGVQHNKTGDIYQLVDQIEAEIKADVGAENLMPNLMLHEFEALLFSAPESFSYCGISNRALDQLRSIRARVETPEHINNDPNTAPSKRILSIYPAYVKPLDGFHIAKDIGIDVMCRECKHFDEWVKRLLLLGE